MLLFGHAGLTLGAAVLLSGALTRGQEREAAMGAVAATPPRPRLVVQRLLSALASKMSLWLTTLGRRLDIRLLLVGAFLPDLIDKPLGQIFLSETISNGRIFSHTLLFILVIGLGGFYLYRRLHKVWLLVLVAGSFMHLILDEMWRIPQTLFWPFQGLSFEKIDLTNWLSNLFHALVHEPTVSISELAGAAVIVWFIWSLARRGKIYAFLRNGQI